MDQQELHLELESIGLPLAYNNFIDTPSSPYPAPPYIVYLYSYSSDFMADNHNYLSIGNFQIELYALKKDLLSERLVEDKLKELRLPYNKSEEYIDTEKLYQTIYVIQLI